MRTLEELSILLHEAKGKKYKGKRKDKFQAYGHKNRDMNPETYKLRRAVMDYIYRAKKLLGGKLPRINVRITDLSPEKVLKGVMGAAEMGGNTIWIPATSITHGYDLQHIVYHELLHAAFDIPHIPSSKLMSATSDLKKFTSPDKLDDMFVKHLKEVGKV